MSLMHRTIKSIDVIRYFSIKVDMSLSTKYTKSSSIGWMTSAMLWRLYPSCQKLSFTRILWSKSKNKLIAKSTHRWRKQFSSNHTITASTRVHLSFKEITCKRLKLKSKSGWKKVLGNQILSRKKKVWVWIKTSWTTMHFWKGKTYILSLSIGISLFWKMQENQHQKRKEKCDRFDMRMQFN